MKPNKTTIEWRDMINGLDIPEPAKLVLRQIITQAVSSAKQEERERFIKALEELKAKAHEEDGEKFGYELLEEERRCCPGDDATAVFEITLDKVLSLITTLKGE